MAPRGALRFESEAVSVDGGSAHHTESRRDAVRDLPPPSWQRGTSPTGGSPPRLHPPPLPPRSPDRRSPAPLPGVGFSPLATFPRPSTPASPPCPSVPAPSAPVRSSSASRASLRSPSASRASLRSPSASPASPRSPPPRASCRDALSNLRCSRSSQAPTHLRHAHRTFGLARRTLRRSRSAATIPALPRRPLPRPGSPGRARVFSLAARARPPSPLGRLGRGQAKAWAGCPRDPRRHSRAIVFSDTNH